MKKGKMPRELLISSVFIYLGANILVLFGIPFHIKTIALSMMNAGKYEDIAFFFGPYYKVQIICLIAAFICTVILTCSQTKEGFPDKYTIIAMIYNCIVFLIILSLIHYLNAIHLIIPYTVLYLIPVISSIGSIIFLLRDLSIKRKQDKGLAILETKPLKTDVKKKSTVTALEKETENPLKALIEIGNRTVKKSEEENSRK